MKRLVVVVLVSASVLAVLPVVAGAGPTKSVDYTLSGTSQWTPTDVPSSFAISGAVASGNHAVGTYSGTVSISGFSPCAEPNNPYGPTCASVTGGTIAFAVRGGSFTTAVGDGTVWRVATGPSSDEYVYEPTLTVTGGTKAYASASGTLALHYDTGRSNFSPDPVTFVPCIFVDVTTCPIRDVGTVSGTISR